jgi:flagellar hook-associated protein 3 FlgL
MRISTNMIYEAGVARMNEQQSALLKTQQQISANRRILTPADDPIASARALDLAQGKSVNEQYATNRQNAKDALAQEEGVLSSITSLIQDLQTQIVTAGNGSYDNDQRKYIATDLRSRFEELMGLANSRDGEGNYMFAGYQTSAQPFASSASGVQYFGDQGQKLLQVGPARQIAVNDTGDALFDRISRYDTFTVTPNLASSSSASVSGFSVYDASSLRASPDKYNYVITFSNDPLDTTVPTTYQVDAVPATVPASPPVAKGNYTPGEAIKFNGLQVVISGAPVDGDNVTVSPVPPGNQSLFKTLKDMITQLETPADGAAGKANLAHGLEVASGNLASALDNVLKIRASVGSRLREIDALDAAGADRDLQYSDAISKLTDLDYAKAISDLVKQKTTLEAAQKTFVQTTGLSLFNLL